MEPDKTRTARLESPEGFVVSTDFECGHGIVTLAGEGIVEIEIIAFSKDPRYVCARVDALRDCQVRLRVLPDQQSGMGFSKFHSWIWKQQGDGEEWQRLTDAQLQIHNECLMITVSLKAGEYCILSSEPSFPYSQTCDWLRSLEGKHGFELVEIGQSVEGREIWSLQNVQSKADKPAILVIAGEHGTEFAGECIARGMLEAVMEESAAGEALRERFHWSFILNANPDGNVNGWHQYNRTDWRKHRYPFPEDISWHHEFAIWLEDEDAEVSPETRAIGSHVLNYKPSLLFNLHSWQGNNGNIGVYRSSLSIQDFPQVMNGIEGVAEELTVKLGVKCLGKDSGNLASGHLGDTLALYSVIPAFSPEGHMIIGEDNLRWFGREWIQRSLELPQVRQALDQIHANIEERYGSLRLPADRTPG